jgi:hypothetical protein
MIAVSYQGRCQLESFSVCDSRIFRLDLQQFVSHEDVVSCQFSRLTSCLCMNVCMCKPTYTSLCIQPRARDVCVCYLCVYACASHTRKQKTKSWLIFCVVRRLAVKYMDEKLRALRSTTPWVYRFRLLSPAPMSNVRLLHAKMYKKKTNKQTQRERESRSFHLSRFRPIRAHTYIHIQINKVCVQCAHQHLLFRPSRVFTSQYTHSHTHTHTSGQTPHKLTKAILVSFSPLSFSACASMRHILHTLRLYRWLQSGVEGEGCLTRTFRVFHDIYQGFVYRVAPAPWHFRECVRVCKCMLCMYTHT